jgi:succinate dehydrogenase / fumarate reductase, cytochrome b subunit
MSHPSSRNALHWFDPRRRKVGSWAFILNRLTALALTFYLGLHLVVLNKLTQGAQAYNDFVAFAQIPFIKTGEIILISAVILHGLNGVRLTLLTFGIGLRHQKILFIFSAVTTILVVAFFAIRLLEE